MKKHVFTGFVELINNHDAHEMSSMMTDDHTFIDAHGNRISGKDMMTEGWKQYFSMFPDYWIEIDEVIEASDIVFGFGTASATYTGHISGDAHNFFKIPAAFKAIIDGEKIKVWQVYADTKLPFDIITRNTHP